MSLFGSFWKKGSRISRKASSVGKWQVGDKIAGRYEIYQILGGEGKSGMGIVYICYDHKQPNSVVLKTFQDKFFNSEEGPKLLKREALVWTELGKFPYIVRTWWTEKLEDQLFINLEYIPPDTHGRNTLTHYLGSLSFPDILKLSIQFCYGMEYAYAKGIDAHRDIKPDNIMITPDKTVKITDFGLAKAFQEIQLKEKIISKEENPSLSIFQSKGKRICGTLPYMAPEQFDGYADKRSDIYAFGITLYQMVTNGRLPFIGRTSGEYEKLHKYEKVAILSSPLSSLIQKCLEKKPENRFQDFSVVREELQRFILHETGETIILPTEEQLGADELSNKGLAFCALGKYQEAIICCDKALQMDPRNSSAWNNKGTVLFNIGNYEDSVSCFKKAIEITPRNDVIWENKGNALVILERFEEAILCCDEAINLNSIEAWVIKGLALCGLGRNQEAFECVEEAIRLGSRSPAAHELKQVLLNNKD